MPSLSRAIHNLHDPRYMIPFKSWILKGDRWNFAEIIPALCTTTDEDVGVLVSGSSSMQEAVASMCRSHNFRNLGHNQLHYHSISFDLWPRSCISSWEAEAWACVQILPFRKSKACVSGFKCNCCSQPKGPRLTRNNNVKAVLENIMNDV